MTEENGNNPPQTSPEQQPEPDKTAESRSADKPGDEERQQAASGGGRNVALVLLALLAVIAIAAAGYSFYLSYQLQTSYSQAQAKQQTLADNLDRLERQQQQSGQSLDDLRESQEATSVALERLAQREKMDNLDWAMAEIEYLTIIAMQRLNLAHDVDTSLAALEAAARRLKDLQNPTLIPVREQLTRDINALKAVPDVDISGMALYLADLVQRADSLPLANDRARPATPAAADGREQPVEGWRGMIAAIWQELRQLVVIQRTDEPPQALMAPDERYFLHQNLRLELDSARLAVLQRDTRNLQASIELVRGWLERYFNTDAEAVANIQESLGQMATVELQPELPDISGSLESVRAWQRRQTESDASQESE